jgi:hypothetical protein
VVGNSDVFLPTRSLTIALKYTALSGNNMQLLIDEIQVYGYSGSTVPAPQGLIDYLHTVGDPETQCMDERYIRRLLESDHTYYEYEDLNSVGPYGFRGVDGMNYSTASTRCTERGGFLAISRGGEDTQEYALFTGEKCPEGRCLVDARNRDEKQSPPMTDFIRAPCSQWGCWTPKQEDYQSYVSAYFLGDIPAFPRYRGDFVSTPGDDGGLQWQIVLMYTPKNSYCITPI